MRDKDQCRVWFLQDKYIYIYTFCNQSVSDKIVTKAEESPAITPTFPLAYPDILKERSGVVDVHTILHTWTESLNRPRSLSI